MATSEPKYIYVEKKIIEAIKHMDVNDKIPGERIFAKELGISYMTVRKAFENLVAKNILYKIPKKGTYVSEELLAEKSKTKNIGYFLDGSIKDGLSSPYYSLVFEALEKEATKHGYALIYCSDFNESLKKMEKIDGAIISCFPRIENVVQHVNKMVPIVCIDNSSADPSIPSVVIDNYNSVVDSVKHLFSLGHTRIGFVTGLDDSDVGRNRLAGYLRALSSCGIGTNMELVYKGDYTFETGISGADHFLDMGEPPTAIMCANDIMAVGAIKEICRRGLSVPGDINIIGFDDINIASQMTPALTTVSAPVAKIAEHAVSILNTLISGLEPDNRHLTLPGKLVMRNTCAPVKYSVPAARKVKSN